MNILISGSSMMALRIAEALMSNHQVVSLRASDVDEAAQFDRLDVESIIGLPTSTATLQAARVDETDVFVACTDNDEQNIVACLAAQKLGARRTICVLAQRGFLSIDDRSPELAEALGIDEVVRPGEQLAQEIIRIVTIPGALDVRVFADGHIALLRYAVEESSPITSGPLKSVTLPEGVVLVTIRRKGKMLVPRGDTTLSAGDKVLAMGRRPAVQELALLMRSRSKKETRRAAIIGAGSVGLAIALGLERMNWQLKLVESDAQRCEAVAGRVRGMVLLGDGADPDLLEQERIGDMPVVVCVTSNDEKNLLVSLLAKNLGTPRIITRAARLSNEHIFEKVGVDVVLSAHGAAIRSIVQSVDASQAEIKAELEHGSTRVLELTLPSNFTARRLADLQPPEHVVVGSITRGRRVIVPGGAHELLPGDHIFVFCRTEDEEKTRDFFMRDRSKSSE